MHTHEFQHKAKAKL